MDFETSCWSTDSAFHNSKCNPVQRRSKDYFDSTIIPPIVSHISSNGYYGYCATTNVPAVNELHSNSKCNDIDFNITDVIMPMDLTNSEQAQGRTIENRKRHNRMADEIAEQDAKRRRSHLSVIDYAEDMQMGYDDAKDVTDPSNIASNQLPIERFFVCINRSTVAVDERTLRFNCAGQTENVQPMSQSDATMKTDDNATQTHNDTDDMEILYWHTHGSMLWQR